MYYKVAYQGGAKVIIPKSYGGFLVSQIKHLSGRVYEKLLKEDTVDAFNAAQGRILHVLWEHGQLTSTEIGRLTSLARTTLTGMLDRMEIGGLIERIPDKENRRQIFISVTSKAMDYHKIYSHVSEKMNEIFYKGFTESEILIYENMTRKILKNLESERI
jgi:DNA-binding MarR family transcriptional regulator